MNLLGLPVHRTVDVTDNVALMSILFSYYLFNRPSAVVLPTFLTKLMIVIASFAFIATTLPSRKLRKYEAINKQYTFGFPKRELVSRLNMLQLKEIYNLNKLSGQIDFDSKTNIFHYHGNTDTLAVLLDHEQINNSDTITYKSSFAEVMIIDKGETSILQLVNVYRHNPVFKEKDYRFKAIKTFEKRVINKLNKYR
jgi:hypothetical protein